MARRIGLTVALALGMAGTGTVAHAAPSPDRFVPAVAVCDDRAGEFEVLNVGVVGFVLDEAGEPTGEKLFVVEIDAELVADDGTVLVELHLEYGNRTGHGDQIVCSGTVDDVPGATGFFTMTATRR